MEKINTDYSLRQTCVKTLDYMSTFQNVPTVMQYLFNDGLLGLKETIVLDLNASLVYNNKLLRLAFH